ncbi:hypothetical protein QE152_g36268 [Popillia japonica]|uniref:Integrase catalytic domain-containing protein n=1 Tax=Popillia japonica TaxID=7064 RepID=A0AAW1IDF0_POPJA
MLTKIHVAHQGIEKTKARANHSFLVVMDAYSNWLEVVKIQSKSTEEVIRKFMSIFSKFGCPDTLVCDNIPFGSEKMKAFAREWNFNIVTRSPNYPRSNGLGEKAVGIAKKMVKQSMDTNKDMYSMLMEYRNCPLKHIGLSPAQILVSRMCKTKLPVTAELLMPKIHPDVREKLKKRQDIVNLLNNRPKYRIVFGMFWPDVTLLLLDL